MSPPVVTLFLSMFLLRFVRTLLFGAPANIVPSSMPLITKCPEEDLFLPADEGGGFFLPYPGEKVNDRYMVLRKLGFGAYSTTWLVWDSETVDK